MKKFYDFNIVTNNPMVKNIDNYTVTYLEDYSVRDVFIYCRDLIYKGHILYTHPLSGSVKPNETKYKSIIVSKVAYDLDNESAQLISNAIMTLDKLKVFTKEYSETLLDDFKLIDYTVITSALER